MASNQEIVELNKLSDLTAAIRSKYQLLKKNESDYQIQQEKFFKPLKEKNKDENSSSKFKLAEYLSENEISTLLYSLDDKLYGVNNQHGKWYVGQFPINFSSTGIQVSGKTYPATKGLISLLTRKQPRDYSNSDLDSYIQILKNTNHHLTRNGQNIKFRKGNKYENVIKKCFPEFSQTTSSSTPLGTSRMARSVSFEDNEDTSLYNELEKSIHTVDDMISKLQKKGRGSISNHMLLERNKVIKDGELKNNYHYWDDVNELVERLYLLHMSKQAGNNSVINEILDIELELREGGFIV